MDNGYLKLWRSVLEKRIIRSPRLSQAFLWCLLKAVWKPTWVNIKTGKGYKQIKLNPGQLVYQRYIAAEELQMPPSTLRNSLHSLKNDGFLDTQTDTHFTIITIIKWELYQSELFGMDTKEDTQKDTQWTPKVSEAANIGSSQAPKNLEYIKKENDQIGPPPASLPPPGGDSAKQHDTLPLWVDPVAWGEYVAYRKEIKKPLTPIAHKKALNKLKKLMDAGNDPHEVIDQTIENHWKGLFEVKRQRGRKTMTDSNIDAARAFVKKKRGL
jgi:hypothetical protein